MNKDHLQQIFKNYIDRFEEFNSDDRTNSSEYYKWEMPKPFKVSMDKALKAENEEVFKYELDNIRKITHDFIDSGKTLPFAGLVKAADKEWETVQRMFRELYKPDDGNLDIRQEKIESFLAQANHLKDKNNLSDLYKSDFRSVTAYLFLYDPDYNYIYKPTHVQDFQDCIEFYDDFGEGDHVNLKAYYQMCDWLVDAIRETPSIKETNKLRAPKFKKEPYLDTEWHILAYDIIYCCSAYNLFRGITFIHHTSKERKVLWEKQQKAQELYEKLKAAQEEKKILDAAMDELGKWLVVGESVTFKSFGKATPVEKGIIIKKGSTMITIDFGDGNIKTIDWMSTVTNGYLKFQKEESGFANTVETLKKASQIKGNLSTAEREFALYSEYI